MLLRRFHTAKCSPPASRVQSGSYQPLLPVEPKWKVWLWLVFLALLLALLIGTVMGAIQFIRWRGIW
jgi:hypothetical protein